MPNKRVKSLTMTAAAAAMLWMSPPSHAGLQKNVMFVLDASNSMWGQIDGKPKIEIAKSVLKGLAAKMPADAKMGLIAYGHRFDRKLNECGDMELMNPIGHFSAGEAANSFRFITPKGQTPIAETLQATADWLEEQKGQDNTVVLISDGLESCDGDPCAAAKALNDAGVTTRIHVVGFDLSAEQRAKLECISENGNGKMFAANDSKSLSDAMNKVREDVAKPVEIVAAEPEPAPQPAKPEIVFEDQFDGDDLSEGWEISNPNPDRYVAESGELLIIAGKPKHSPSSEDSENLIIHPKTMPDGDWVLEVKLKIEMQTGAEAFYFGVHKDHENWLAGGLNAYMASNDCAFRTFLAKSERGKMTAFNQRLVARDTGSAFPGTGVWRKCGYGDTFSKLPFILKLTKSGRSYQMTGSFGVEGDEGHITFKTETLKMLRGKTNLFVSVGLQFDGDRYEGEGTAIVDYVRVQSVPK